MTRHLIVASSIALMGLASPAAAQGISTGNSGDWTACYQLVPVTGPCGKFQGVQDAGQAGGWANVDWIAPIDAASQRDLGKNGNGENPRWEVTFRTVLGSAGGTGTIYGTDFYLDNYFVDFRFNGASVAPTWTPAGGGYSGVPLLPNGTNWNKMFGFTLDNLTFLDAPNIFDIVITGNGDNDGIALSGRYNVVPEPGSLALLATGLLGLGTVVARRRRA